MMAVVFWLIGAERIERENREKKGVKQQWHGQQVTGRVVVVVVVAP